MWRWVGGVLRWVGRVWGCGDEMWDVWENRDERWFFFFVFEVLKLP